MFTVEIEIHGWDGANGNYTVWRKLRPFGLTMPPYMFEKREQAQRFAETVNGYDEHPERVRVVEVR